MDRHEVLVKGDRRCGRTHRLNTVSVRDGGNMVDELDEDPAVRSMFEEELKKHGVPSRMPALKKSAR